MKKLYFVIILLFTFTLVTSAKKPTNELSFIQKIIKKNNGKISSSTQLIIVYNKNLKSHIAKVLCLEKINGKWQLIFPSVNTAIGKKGFAKLDQKKEGDLKTPTGLFPLALIFGYSFSVDTKMPYKQAKDNDFWVDDPESDQYNKWVSGKINAKSAERMKRKDHLYKYGIVVEYNVNPIIKGKGSAMFFHIWRYKNRSSAGCVVMNEKNILRIIKWLDKNKKPLVIMGTTEILLNTKL
ncbi:MAG: L,D-transpeptidase family protein [Spirochaetota bacterium]|nr:L,D-transpeptidase family protein [Spirochaetota bacterium]